MFLFILLGLLVGAGIHASVTRRQSRQAIAELALLYVLVVGHGTLLHILATPTAVPVLLLGLLVLSRVPSSQPRSSAT
jgi:hypothetical protein